MMMMRRSIALVLLLAAAPVFAADPPAPAPAYVPFSVDEAHYNALRAYLDQQPFKSALPIARKV
jgi:hypothetical protein